MRARGIHAGPATVQDLLRQRDELPAGHPGRAVLRARGVEAGLPLARHLAARYRGRGEPLEDLYQVAALALVRAVDMYDPTRRSAFTSYAVPTITGALKRHFRDTTWRIRPPRRIQELALSIAATSASLTQLLGRSPTRRDLAAHLDTTEVDVAIALTAWQAHHPDSLDALSVGDGEQPPAARSTPSVPSTPGLDRVIERESLRPLLGCAATAGTPHPCDALCRRHVPVRDRRPDRSVADAHLPPALRSLTTLRAGMSDR